MFMIPPFLLYKRFPDTSRSNYYFIKLFKYRGYYSVNSDVSCCLSVGTGRRGGNGGNRLRETILFFVYFA